MILSIFCHSIFIFFLLVRIYSSVYSFLFLEGSTYKLNFSMLNKIYVCIDNELLFSFLIFEWILLFFRTFFDLSPLKYQGLWIFIGENILFLQNLFFNLIFGNFLPLLYFVNTYALMAKNEPGYLGTHQKNPDIH